VIPIASGEADVLTLLQREGEGFRTEVIGPCRFVPLIGEKGFGE
jgi:protein-L-isoaspartate O-methyltransferase